MNLRTPWNVAVAAALVAAPSMSPAYERPTSDCTAGIEATLDRRQARDDGSTTLTFTVVTTSGEDCAEVAWDLVLEEWMTNDQTHKIRIPGDVRLTGEPVAEVVKHRLLPGYRLLGHEARVALCRVCVVEP